MPTHSISDFVEDYFTRKWAIVPVEAKSKKAAISWGNGSYKPYPSAQAAIAECTNQNIGIALGERSGNLIDVDIDTPIAEKIAYLFLPDTRTFGHGNRPISHRIYYTDEPTQIGRILYNDVGTKGRGNKGKPLIELRGNRCMSVFPGSIHESGEPIEWRNPDTAIATINQETLITRAGQLHAATLFAMRTDEGTRHDGALAIGGWLARAGYPLEDAVLIVRAIAKARGRSGESDSAQAVRDSYSGYKQGKTVYGRTMLDDMYGASVVRLAAASLGIVPVSKKVRSLALVTQIQGRQPEDAQDTATTIYTDGETVPCTHHWNALLFKNKYGENVRYCVEEKQWYVWNEKYWEADTMMRVYELAKDIRLDIITYASSLTGQARQMMAEWATHTSAGGALDAMLSEAAKIYPELKISSTDFNTKPHLFVCDTGTYDLGAGELLPFRKEDMLTQHSEYAPLFDGIEPLVIQMARYAIDNDTSLRELAKGFGLGCSGKTDKALFLCVGETDTGKTTLLNALKKALGKEYATQMADDAITQSMYRRRDLWAADLDGARFALASETAKGAELDVAAIKSMTGDSTQKAKALYRMPFDSMPTYSIFIDTNYRPKMTGSGDDEAMWNRVRIIHFKNKVRVRAGDARYIDNFSERIETPEEMGRLLAWAFNGYRLWKQEGLRESDEMKKNKEEYREEEDIMLAFVDSNLTHCPDDAKALVGQDRLKKLYREWGYAVYGRGFPEPDWADFNKTLEKRWGFIRPEKTKWCEGKTQRVWQYMRVISSEDTGRDVPEREITFPPTVQQTLRSV